MVETLWWITSYTFRNKAFRCILLRDVFRSREPHPLRPLTFFSFTHSGDIVFTLLLSEH